MLKRKKERRAYYDNEEKSRKNCKMLMGQGEKSEKERCRDIYKRKWVNGRMYKRNNG